MKVIQAGSPRPLGATWNGRGVNFALFSSNATRVEVCLFDAESGAELERCDLPARTGDVWHGLISPRRACAGALYAFHVHGPNEPQKGHRFDATAALIDPYARELSRSPGAIVSSVQRASSPENGRTTSVTPLSAAIIL